MFRPQLRKPGPPGKAPAAEKKTARKGLTSKGPGFVVRGVGKSHISHGFQIGKRRVGAYGVRVTIGHS